MTSKINGTRTRDTYVTPMQNKDTGVNNAALDVPVGGNTAIKEGYGDKLNINAGLTEDERATVDKYYEMIREICNEQKIPFEFAKNQFKLLEKLLGVQSTKELAKIKEDTIILAVKMLDDHLGWGDGLGFGEKDENDLNKLVNDIQIKKAYKKTGGSKFGQSWHNIKNNVIGFFGGDTLDKNNTSESISNYFKQEYLSGIENLSQEKKKQAYEKALRKFIYEFNRVSKEKQIMMVESIKHLAAQDRDLVVEIMETILRTDNKYAALFGKELYENYESIVLNKDFLGSTVKSEEATKISHTAFKHMTEKDIEKALSTMKIDADEFYNKYGAQIESLKARKANGETLSEEEENLLLISQNCYVSKYAGATTGTYCNNNLEDMSRINFLSQISCDTEENGIQEEVFQAVNNFVETHPEAINYQTETFNLTMNQATGGRYAEVVNATANNNNSQNKNNIEITEENKVSTQQTIKSKYSTAENLNNSTVDYNEELTARFENYTTNPFDNKNNNNQEMTSTKTEAVCENKENSKETQNSHKESISAKKTVVEVSHSTKDFVKYVKDNGVAYTVKEIYDNWDDITNNGVKIHTKKLYTMLNPTKQEEILRSIKSPSGFIELLKLTPDEVVMGLEHNFNSYYTNQLVENAKKEVQERQQRHFA